MSDPDSAEKRLSRRDEDTSPFPLERSRSEPPPPSGETETSQDRTGPFMLEREKTDSDAPPPKPASIPPKQAPAPLTKSARRARRAISVTLLVHGLLLATLATLSMVRWSKGLATPPELAFGVLTGGVALVHLRAGFRFSRIGHGAASRDGARLVGALSDLRTVIVLKAVTLFLALTLLCFSLSMVISLVASF